MKHFKWKGWKDVLGYKTTGDVATAMGITSIRKARYFIKKHNIPHSKTSGGHIRLHDEQWKVFLNEWAKVRLNLN